MGGQLTQPFISGTTAYLAASGVAAAERTIWAVDNYGYVWRWNGTAWTQQSGIVAADDSAWFLGTATVDKAGDHAIYRFANGKLTQMPGSASVLTSGRGVFFATTAAGQVIFWNGNAWVHEATVLSPGGSLFVQVGSTLWRIPSGIALGQWQFFAGGVGAFAIDTSDDSVLAEVGGAIWRAPADSADGNGYGLWSTLGSSAVIAPDGRIWFMGTGNADGHGDYPLYRIASGQLTKMPGVGIGLGVADGILYSVTLLQQAWSWNGTAWVQQTTALDRSNSGLYFLGVAKADSAGEHGIYHWNSGQLTSVPAKAVALGSASPGFWASMPAIKSGTMTATL